MVISRVHWVSVNVNGSMLGDARDFGQAEDTVDPARPIVPLRASVEHDH